MKYFLIIIALAIVLGVASWVGSEYYRSSATSPIQNNFLSQSTTSTPPETGEEEPEENPVLVISPASGSIVSSPLSVKGQARGTWFFEANLPVAVTDQNGNVLGQVGAQAVGNWMTTSFVPFKATLSFATSTTDTGYLVVKKDNPSGLPQNDAQVKIPIRFR